MKKKDDQVVWYGAAVSIACLFVLTSGVQAYSEEMKEQMRKESIKGPWEISVRIDSMQKQVAFPLKIKDENKAQKLQKRLPVMGTPIKIKLDEYLPDLTWEDVVKEKPGAAAIVKLAFKGPALDQKM